MTEQVAAVQRMQDFIAAHLDEEITLADLERAAMFSPWYSYRLFKSLTGLTVSGYIRRLRLARSALKLKNEGCRIVDAAFALGFGSVDGYARIRSYARRLREASGSRRAVRSLRCEISSAEKGFQNDEQHENRLHSNDPQAGAPGSCAARTARGGLLRLLRGGRL